MSWRVAARFFFAVGVVFFFVGLFSYASWWPSSALFGRVVSRVEGDGRAVFLTFDDGPSENTRAVLDVLDAYGVRATFFLVGRQVVAHPDVVEELVSRGHVVGVHSFSHRFLWRNCSSEMAASVEAVKMAANVTPSLFRPPYGFRLPWTLSAARNANLTTVLWSLFPRDYASSEEEIVRKVLGGLEPGVIIVLHDGEGNRSSMVAALPRIIEGAREEGFVFDVLSPGRVLG